VTRPCVVAIGGGHGLSVTLRALAPWAEQVTGVVSTADDGGSTGRLRESWDVPALGDVRRCLATLAVGSGVGARAGGTAGKARNRAEMWANVLERRFEVGELAGHAVGNLLLLALTEELGDLQSAADEIARTAGIDIDRARIVPVTDDAIVLCGRTTDGLVVEGQVAVASTVGIEEVWVDPGVTAASQLAIEAIRGADLVVLGPGSLYTSVLAAVVVGEMRGALADTSARVAYVANLRAEQDEAKGYDLAAHVEALSRHGIRTDVVLVDPGSAVPLGTLQAEVVEAAVADTPALLHDADRLGAALRSLIA
jgi:uncharacterized cofD-like protein